MIVEVTTLPIPILQLIAEDSYEVLVAAPPPIIVEVKGLFATTFIQQDIDGGIIF